VVWHQAAALHSLSPAPVRLDDYSVAVRRLPDVLARLVLADDAQPFGHPLRLSATLRRRLGPAAFAHGVALASRVVGNLENLVGRLLVAPVDDPLRRLLLIGKADRAFLVRLHEVLK
jgi:hypothetical protein